MVISLYLITDHSWSSSSVSHTVTLSTESSIVTNRFMMSHYTSKYILPDSEHCTPTSSLCPQS